MDIKFILSQICGLVALAFLAMSFSKNRKKHLLKFQSFANLAYSAQYFLLGAYVGFSLHMMCLFRNIVFSNYKNGKVPLYFLIIVIILMIGLSMLSYRSIFDIIPIIGLVLNSYGLWQKKLKVSRLCEIIACILLIIYNILVHAYTGIIAVSFELIMTLYAMYKYDFKKKASVKTD